MVAEKIPGAWLVQTKRGGHVSISTTIYKSGRNLSFSNLVFPSEKSSKAVND
jgi:hypothetical protein